MDLSKKVVIGSDHAGFEAKEQLKEFLKGEGYDVTDVGTDSLLSCDYPDFAFKVGETVMKDHILGVLICGSGEGAEMAANKVNGVRAAIGYNDEVSRLARQHNDANVITFGARFMDIKDIERRSIIFLTTAFEGGRHQKRVDKILEYENK